MGLTIRGFVKESLREFYSRLKTKLSGVAFSGNYSDLNGKPTLDLTPTENSSNPVSSGGVYNTIAQSEYVISTSLNDLNTRVSDIEDGLGNLSYLPLSGGDMEDDSSIKISDENDSSRFSTFSHDGFLSAYDGTSTQYSSGAITNGSASLILPSTSGTLALTSNLVWSPGTGTKSARLAPNSTVSGSYSAACGAYSQILNNYSFTNGVYTKTYGIGAFASGCFVSAANGNGVAAAFGGNYASGIVLTGDANATTYTGTISDSQLKFLLDNYYSSNVTSAFVNGGFIYDSSLFTAKITAFSYSSGTLTITFDRTLSSTAISNKSYNLVVCISGGEGSTTFTGFTSNNARWSLAGGRWSAALQEMAFSWGNMSVANAQTSFALGHYAQTKNLAETGLGRYNKSTYTSSTFGNAGNTAFSVGIGSSHSARKNAIEIMQNGDLYVTGVGSYDGTNYSSASTLQSVLGTIPAAVTESTVSGWGFTKNAGTYSKPSGGIPASDLASAVQTSLGKADTALQSFTETDPIFSASAAAGITASDITAWNSKVSNVQSDWNATTGLGVILNKPTIPSTLDDILDGSTRKLANYLPLSGGVMSADATLTFVDSSDDHSVNIRPYRIVVSNSSDDYTVFIGAQDSPFIEISDGSDSTTYKEDGIVFDNGSSHVLSFPSKSGTLALTSDIPSAITESTVSGWGFTKNAGTLTGVKVNGSNATVTSGVADIGTVITSETQLSKGTTTGSGNAVTDISVSNHQITLTKGSTFLTSHQSIKTINNQTITGTGNVTLDTLPTVSASDNGKILMVVNGAWTLVSPVTIYSGSGEPNNSMGNNGDIYLQT